MPTSLERASEGSLDNECSKCGMEWDWDGDSEQSRVCLACQLEEAEHLADLRRDRELDSGIFDEAFE